MEQVIFGFGTDMNRCPVMEIFLYLIVYSMMIGLAGRVAFQKRMIGQYPSLIRYRKFSAWWHRTVLKVLAVSLLLVLLLFGVGAFVLSLTEVKHTDEEWIRALFLWIVGFCTAALIQTVFIQFRNGYKIVFAFVMCIVVVSLYLPWLPGSWLMYERSQLAVEGGFSIWAICAAQIGADILLGLFGYLLLKPRRGYESGN